MKQVTRKMRRTIPPAMDTARMVDWLGSPIAKTSTKETERIKCIIKATIKEDAMKLRMFSAGEKGEMNRLREAGS